MIDSLLYATLPPKLKPSVKMARLENGTYEEIVAHLERELELNALEESDDLPIATMASTFTCNRNLLSNGIDTNKEAQLQSNWHFYINCLKLTKKKEIEKKMAKNPTAKHTQHVKPVAKKVTHWKHVGKVPDPSTSQEDPT